MTVSSTLKSPAFTDSPVWKRVITQTWETSDGHAEQSQPVEINGILTKVILKVSSVTGDPDVTLTIDDHDGNERFDSDAKDDGNTYAFSTWEPLAGVSTVNVDPSADPGGSGQTLTVVITLWGVR